MAIVPTNTDFCIHYSFDKVHNNPMRVFRSIADILESFSQVDKLLVTSIDEKIEPVIMIEDIEAGSIKVWIKSVLSSFDDDALKELDWKKQVGSYLVKAKYAILNFLEDKVSITDAMEVEAIEVKLLELARETEVLLLPCYTPVQKPALLETLADLSRASQSISEGDSVAYETLSGNATFNASFQFSAESVASLLTRESLTSNSVMILQVKKPDYLGDSKWEFRHGTRNFTAKITDEAWVRKFQSRQIDIRPGDALKVEAEAVVAYGHRGEVVGQTTTVLKVFEVVGAEVSPQIRLEI